MDIRIILEAFTQGKSLDGMVTDLERILQLMLEIRKYKDSLNFKSNIGDLAKAIAQIEKLNLTLEKVMQTQQKRSVQASDLADKEAKKRQKILDQYALEQGLLGKLKIQIADLNKQKLFAKTPEQIAAVNRRLDEAKLKFRELGSIAQKNTNTFGNALSSFQYKFNLLGNFIGGLGTQIATGFFHKIIEGVNESREAFREAELNEKQLEFAVKNIANGSTGAVDVLLEQAKKLQAEGIFSDDDIVRAQTMLVQFGLTTDAVRELTPVITDFAAANRLDVGDATKIVVGGLNGVTKRLKQLGIDFKATGDRTKDLATLTQKLSKFQGSMANALNTSAGAAANLDNRMNDLQESIGGIIDQWVSGAKATFVDIADLLSGKGQQGGIGAFGIGLFNKEFQKKMDELRKIAEQGGTKLKEQNLKLIGETVRSTEVELKALQIQYDIVQKNTKDQTILDAYLGKVSVMQLQLNALKELEEDVKRIGQVETPFSSGSDSKDDDDAVRKRIKAEEDLQTRIEKIKVESIKDDNIRKLKQLELDAELEIKSVQQSEASEQKKAELILLIRQKLQQDINKFNEEQLDAQKEADKKEEDEARRHHQELVDLQKKEFKDIQDQRDADAEKRRQEEKERQDEIDALKDKRKKDLEDTYEGTRKLVDAVIEEYNRMLDARLKTIDDQITAQDKQIEIQQRLAEKGEANTLAFELKQKAKLERQRIEEQKRQERIKEIEAFFNAFAAYAKDDPKTAALKAFKDVVLARLIAGRFKHGGIVEDEIAMHGGRSINGILQGPSHERGGILIEAEGKEGIFSTREMANLGKDNFYRLKDLLRTPVDEDVFQSQADSMQAYLVPVAKKQEDETVKEIRKLQTIIRNKPETKIYWDSFGDMIEETLENGIKKITTHKKKPRIG